MLLWSLKETALQLGGVSIRTVRRLADERAIIPVKVRGSVKIQPESVHAFVAGQTGQAHNSGCVGSLAWKGIDPCYTNAKAHRTGMQTTPTQPAKELDALLAQLTKGKLKH